MSAVPRPKRQAIVGETVMYFENGDPTEEPHPVVVEKVLTGSNVTFVYHRIDGNVVRHEVKSSIKHIHDECWDSAPLSAKQNRGAWDFHPVLGQYVDKNLAVAHARAAKEETADA